MLGDFKPDEDFYRAIGLERNATERQIKKRIHSLAKELHPDKSHTSETEDLMKELNKIKSTLLDKVEKRKYDEDLACKVVPLFMRKNRGTILLPPSKYSCTTVEPYISCTLLTPRRKHPPLQLKDKMAGPLLEAKLCNKKTPLIYCYN